MRSLRSLTIKAVIQSDEAAEAVTNSLSGVKQVKLDVVREPIQDALYSSSGVITKADIYLVDLDLENENELNLLESFLRNGAAGTPVIATSLEASVDALRRLMRLQIVDYLPQPLVRGDLLSALQTTITRLQQKQQGSGPRSTVFTFVKPAGGMGATTLALQTAFELRGEGKEENERRVCFVDLDLYFGSSSIYLDIEPGLNPENFMGSPQRLDAALIESMAIKHQSGIDVLCSPGVENGDHQIAPAAMLRLLEIVSAEYDYVVIDLPQSWAQWIEDVISGSDVTLLVFQANVAAIRKARALAQRLDRLQTGGTIQRVVLNRFETSSWRNSLKLSQVEKALGRDVDFTVENNYKLVSEALNHGVPLRSVKRGNRIERQIGGMVKSCLESVEKEREASGNVIPIAAKASG